MQPEELNHHQQIQSAAVVAAAGDDFLDQMLSALPSAWTDLGNPKSPWDLAPTNPRSATANGRNLFSDVLAGNSPDDSAAVGDLYAQYEDPSPLAFRMRSLDDVDASFKALNSTGVEGLYSGFGGPLQRGGNQTTVQNHFQNAQAPPPLAAAVGAGGGCAAPPRQRVRARRGQATDPHSIAERLRREKIAERMKGLQELVPNANKTDKASMLDEIIDYVKFLQLQVKVLSMSRLGGAAAVAPLMADVSSEAGRGGGNTATTGSDRLAVSENQVAKLMEEDMGSAMQYLQGKGLCLMPISLASAISTAAGLIPPSLAAGGAPSSPSMSALTVQSAVVADAVKDAASVSKP